MFVSLWVYLDKWSHHSVSLLPPSATLFSYPLRQRSVPSHNWYVCMCGCKCECWLAHYHLLNKANTLTADCQPLQALLQTHCRLPASSSSTPNPPDCQPLQALLQTHCRLPASSSSTPNPLKDSTNKEPSHSASWSEFTGILKQLSTARDVGSASNQVRWLDLSSSELLPIIFPCIMT